jgi:hypothetical protein
MRTVARSNRTLRKVNPCALIGIIASTKGTAQRHAMIAFEVYLNGKKICTAGVGDTGVLTACLSYRGALPYEEGGPQVRECLTIDVGGYLPNPREHLRWRERKLKPGDSVTLNVVKAESVDRPRERERTNAAANLRRRKQYVRRMAKELGWKLQT